MTVYLVRQLKRKTVPLLLTFVFIVAVILSLVESPRHRTTFPSATMMSPVSFHVNSSTRRFRHGCYERGVIKATKTLLPAEALKELHCEQRPPDVVVFGVKKSGTATLKEFLAFHPVISMTTKELHFLSNSSLAKGGLSKYKSLMPYSLPYQIPVESTPGYLVRPDCAERLKKLIPNCKLIAILRDPVQRAISDFVHISWTRDHKGSASELSPKTTDRVPRYFVGKTMTDSVLFRNGSLRTWNSLLDTGLYYKHVKHWLGLFPPENFLFLDAYDLINNPVKLFKELEGFLGLTPFFSEEVFGYNRMKRFYCIQFPVYACMPSTKGRRHPRVHPVVIEKLQRYFEPYNKLFSKLVNKTFSWTTYKN